MSDDLAHRLADAEATIAALISGQVDAVVDPGTRMPLLLAKAQDDLRESEARFRRIVETSREGIWTLDQDGKTTFVNQRLADMLKTTVAAMLTQPVSDFLANDDDTEVALRCADGSQVWVLLNTSPITDANGMHVGVLFMITDRSLHRASQQALRRSEEEHRQIVETITDGVIKTDASSKITFVNRRLLEILGYTASELIGCLHHDFICAPSRTATLAALARNGNVVVETIYCSKTGTEIDIDLTAATQYDAQNNHVSTIYVLRDMTDRKRLQTQLMVSDRMASVGTIAAGVAHEINNPLAAVITNLDCIADVLDASNVSAKTVDEIQAPLDDARTAAQRVRVIAGDLKIFSRSPRIEPRVSVSVETVMETSLRMAWHEIRHRAQVVKDYQPVSPVEVNEARLGQVFLNLIVNAAQALPEDRREQNEIRIRTYARENRVVIEVSDTGPGIPPAVISRIFDAFFTTKAVGVGTGLGLAISHRIITDLGGFLTVESIVDVGTTFRVDLPPSIIQPLPAFSAPVVTAADRRGTILVIDDEEAVARGVRRILSRDHDVVLATSAADGLARCLAGESYDVILCDLMMPNMTGMELHTELARQRPDAANRMVFLTGGAFTSNARTFLAATPNICIEKPFDSANLRSIIRSRVQ